MADDGTSNPFLDEYPKYNVPIFSPTVMDIQAVPEHINFPNEEENVLQVWKKIDAFRTSLEQSKNRPKYIFYDGPPFATGLPHYGHILAGTVKDVVTRWAHQSGFHVERRFGWDCHGLPVEYEIDKAFNIRGPEDVAKMGIENYNKECRNIVSRYATEWEEIVTRLGRWIDFKNDYKTMYPWFMESVWWVFKQLFDKGLVYKGFKVMPFSTACSTPLSNFESGQNYKEVQDPAVIVSFPLVAEPGVSMIAWTTTPWTLPSNMTLCVHPQLLYVKVKDKSNGKVYIMMEARLSALFKTPEEYEILEKFLGETLEGKEYVPLFPYFTYMTERGAFKVCCDTYVTEESGTGIVHQAPYFGEDDYRVNLRYGVITKDMEPICPVDMSGCFDDRVTDFKGQHVKDADKNIMVWLKNNGRMVHHGTVNHNYPYCWRSDTPLIYRAVPSWFVRVEQMQEKLLESNAAAYWVPDFVKEKRFGNWLRDARDWAISRNRYWGTPIPLWVSDDGQEIVCVGSIEELQELTGRKDITDLHRESIDGLTIPSRCGKGTLRRVPEVFDCWFESGSMPYAQKHYPFENKKDFEDGFPGDFIAEGIDQTRGWFYTLLVLSTALFGKTPFKNLICHGLVLAADGQKMSKRKKNYPDPMDIVHTYGADAIRLYLINSPVVRADNLRFKEEGVRDILKDVFLPWYNAYRFLIQNVIQYYSDHGENLKLNEDEMQAPSNYMDLWILSFTQSLLKYVKEEMTAYRLYAVVPRLVRFVDQLTNWYVRMNRRRLKGDTGRDDCTQALHTLTAVLFSMTKVMAPFIPFLTEHMYQNLRHLVQHDGKDEDAASVHFLMIPTPREDLIDTEIEESVSHMQTVIDLGRVVRDRKTMPIKYPLKEVVVIHREENVLKEVAALKDYILEELNVRVLTTTSEKERYGVRLQAEPNFKKLGARLGAGLKEVMAVCKELTDSQLQEFADSGSLTVCGHLLKDDDLKLTVDVDKTSKDNATSQYEAHSDGHMLVLLDMSPDQSMLDEGLAREVINRIQKARKKAKLVPTDDINIYFEATGELRRICEEQRDFILDTVKQPMITPIPNSLGELLHKETATVKNDSLSLAIERRVSSNNASKSTGPANSSSAPISGLACGELPVCPWVNVLMCEGSSVVSAGLVMLQNPCGQNTLNACELVRQVELLFLQSNRRLKLYTSNRKVLATDGNDLSKLNGSTLYACVLDQEPPSQTENLKTPVCRFVNVQGDDSKTKASLLLENPYNELLSAKSLHAQTMAVFGGASKLLLDKSKKEEVSEGSSVENLHCKTVFVK